MEKLFADIGNTGFGVLECVSLALPIAYAICGISAYSLTRLPKESKFAVAVFMAAMSVVFFELTMLYMLRPQDEKFIAAIIGAEIIILIIFAVFAGILALTSFFRGPAELWGIDDVATPGGAESARPVSVASRPERARYALPDMSDEEIERQLASRNS